MDPVTSTFVAELEKKSGAKNGKKSQNSHVDGGQRGDVTGLDGRTSTDYNCSRFDDDVNTVQEAAASKFEGNGRDCKWQATAATRDIAVTES
jgi:hypothetical protein